MGIYAIIAFIFLACFSICFGILYYLARRKDPVKARLKDIESDSLARGVGENGVPAGQGAALLGEETARQSSTRMFLASAGYRGSSDVTLFYQYTIFGAIAMGALAFGVTTFLRLKEAHVILISIVGLIFGGLLPRLWVLHMISRRREEIRKAVPNILDLMVVCVEAGLSFTAALHRLANETKISCGALSDELRIVTHEILIGKSKADAFRSLANRTGVEELRSLAITLIQSDKFGTSIAQSLRVLADSMRFKRRQRAEEMANKTTVKLVFPLVFLIFPELLVILVGPALIRIVKALSEIAH